jgi:hypothetical protein
MSFFTEPKNAGLAMMIVGILNIIVGIISIILGAIGYEGYSTVPAIITGIGSIIGGILFFGYGSKVRKGEVSQKIDILAGFVKITGIVTIVNGIFNAAANIAGGVDIGTALVSAIISIIIGLIILFIASKINDGKQTTGDKIIWIILLIVFVIEIILAILLIISIVGILYGICNLIIYVFMLLLLLDPEVKSEMNM